MAEELTQEEVFSNDIDPLDAIRELRKEEGVAEEDLPPPSETTSESAPAESEEQDDDLDAFAETSEAEESEDVSEDLDDDAEPKADSSESQTNEEPESTEDSEVEDSENDPAETEANAEKLKFKANGQEFEFTPQEIIDQFETVFGQAMDYTKKMQKIAPYRKMISALEQEGVTQEQLNVAIDALKGDKGAIQQILQNHNIDSMDLDENSENGYTPNQYGKDDHQLQLDEVIADISSDEEYKITVNVIDEQWDQASRQAFAGQPDLIKALHNDIKTGLYDQVAPRAMKMKVLDGNKRSDIEYYMLAGQEVTQQQQLAEKKATVDEVNGKTQAAVQEADKASSEAEKKRAASSTRTRADRQGVIDYLDDDDEAFEAWYNKLQASN